MHHKLTEPGQGTQDSFTQLFSSSFAKLGPREMIEPAKDLAGTAGTLPFQVGGEADVREISGTYTNTTRTATDQKYLYMWKHACQFTTWTPTNQFLHKNYAAHQSGTLNFKEMDLSRFGFIGTDKECFWGLIGVHWIKPLPVAQELTDLKATHSKLHGTYSYA